MFEGVGLLNTLGELFTMLPHQDSSLYVYVNFLIEISYTLSADAQVVPSRVRLIQEMGQSSTGKISGTLTLLKNLQICVNTTAILVRII